MTIQKPTFFGTHRHWLGWIVLVLLYALMIFGGATFGFAFFYQNFFLLSFALGITFSFLWVTAICLALADLHPIKRVFFFGVVSTIVFGTLTFAGFWTAKWIQFAGIQANLGGTERLGFDVAFVCMSFAWIFWFYRLYRGWLITRHPQNNDAESSLTFKSTSRTPWWLEVLFLLTCIGLATFFCLINHQIAFREGILLLFPAGGLVALVLLLPVTYFAMTTRCPAIFWAGFCFGLPVVLSLLFLTARLSFNQNGMPISDDVVAAFVALLIGCGFPVTFLMALRMVGFQLRVSKPWKQKTEPEQPRPHPLDD